MSATQRPPGGEATSGEPTSARTCAICGGSEDDPRLLASCYGCRRTFHLNPYAAPGTDCGDVWAGSSADDEFTGLELYCASCLRVGRAPVGGETPAGKAVPRGVGAPPARPRRPPWRRRYRRLDAGKR